MSVRIFWPVPNLSWGITAASHDTHTEFGVVSQPPGLQDSLPSSRAGAQRGELDAHSGHPWLTIPNAISIVGLVSLTVALEVQVRFVEEPFVHDRPDRFDLIGASICLIGVGVIMPAPR